MTTALALAQVAAPHRGLAQTASDDADTAMARARFKEGVSFFDKGDYDRARAAFKQAYALKKHPSVLLNLAWSCVKGAHVLEGERYFQQLIGEDGRELSDKQRADAADGLAQARGKLGRLEVSAPQGAEVVVDGERAGTAPLEPVWVEPGAHTVKMRSGEAAQTVSVSVLAGEKAVARYAKTAPAPVGPAPAPSTPGPEATAPPPAEVPVTAEKPEGTAPPATVREPERSPSPGGGGGPFSPPANLVPEIVFGGVAVASFVLAGVMVSVKQQAQNSADSVAAAIVKQGGTTCAQPKPYYQGACAQLNTDLNDVNQDATAGNVLLGVGIASVAGGVAYWLLADKKHPPVTVTASVVPSFRGLELSGQF